MPTKAKQTPAEKAAAAAAKAAAKAAATAGVDVPAGYAHESGAPESAEDTAAGYES